MSLNELFVSEIIHMIIEFYWTPLDSSHLLVNKSYNKIITKTENYSGFKNNIFPSYYPRRMFRDKKISFDRNFNNLKLSAYLGNIFLYKWNLKKKSKLPDSIIEETTIGELKQILEISCDKGNLHLCRILIYDYGMLSFLDSGYLNINYWKIIIIGAINSKNEDLIILLFNIINILKKTENIFYSSNILKKISNKGLLNVLKFIKKHNNDITFDIDDYYCLHISVDFDYVEQFTWLLETYKYDNEVLFELNKQKILSTALNRALHSSNMEIIFITLSYGVKLSDRDYLNIILAENIHLLFLLETEKYKINMTDINWNYIDHYYDFSLENVSSFLYASIEKYNVDVINLILKKISPQSLELSAPYCLYEIIFGSGKRSEYKSRLKFASYFYNYVSIDKLIELFEEETCNKNYFKAWYDENITRNINDFKTMSTSDTDSE